MEEFTGCSVHKQTCTIKPSWLCACTNSLSDLLLCLLERIKAWWKCRFGVFLQKKGHENKNTTRSKMNGGNEGEHAVRKQKRCHSKNQPRQFSQVCVYEALTSCHLCGTVNFLCSQYWICEKHHIIVSQEINTVTKAITLKFRN